MICMPYTRLSSKVFFKYVNCLVSSMPNSSPCSSRASHVRDRSLHDVGKMEALQKLNLATTSTTPHTTQPPLDSSAMVNISPQYQPKLQLTYMYRTSSSDLRASQPPNPPNEPTLTPSSSFSPPPSSSA